MVEGGIKYDDVRVNSLDELRASNALPFDQVPILKVGNSKTVAQSASIARYAAKLAGLYSACPQWAAEQDMILDLVAEIRAAYRPFYSLKAEEQVRFKETFIAETVPKFLAKLEKALNGNEYYVANKLSVADLGVFQVLNDALIPLNAELLDAFPGLKALVDRVASRPRIAAYLSERPVTPF